MKFKNLNLKRTFAIISTAILVFFAASCKKCKSCKPEEDRGVRYDNETSTLIFSTQEVDGVFNPFFSTSGTDSNVVGMTQISMLSNDKNGKPTYKIYVLPLAKTLENTKIENVKFGGSVTIVELPEEFNKETNLIVVTDEIYYSKDDKSTIENCEIKLNEKTN